MPADQRRWFDEMVEEVELGFRIGDYWLVGLEDHNDIVWYGGQAKLEAMYKANHGG